MTAFNKSHATMQKKSKSQRHTTHDIRTQQFRDAHIAIIRQLAEWAVSQYMQDPMPPPKAILKQEDKNGVKKNSSVFV